MTRLGIMLLVLSACSSSPVEHHSTESGSLMQVNHDNDFLLAPTSTHDLHAEHVQDSPAEVARVRAALTDARVEVRRNAIVALTAALKEKAMVDYQRAIEDPAPEVYTEAAATIALYGSAYMDRPQNPVVLATVRKYAPKLRTALEVNNATVRYNAANALRAIADPLVELNAMLGDETALVRSVGLELAARRPLSAADVQVLGEVAARDSEPDLRVRAVNVVARFAPAQAVPIVTAAFARGDVNNDTADAVEASELKALVPAIVAYLQKQPKDVRWLQTLVAFRATCAAPAIAELMADYTAGVFAERALRALLEQPTGSRDHLIAVAKQTAGCP